MQGIPLFELCREGRVSELPILLVLHGFSGSKETHLDLGNRLARQGYCVVVFDAHLHGELEPPAFRESDRVSKLGKTLEMWVETSRMTATLVRYYSAQPQTPRRRIGLMGISMGGCVICHYLAHQATGPVDAAVCLIASPSWSHLFEQSNAKYAGMDRYFTADYLRRVQDMQPTNFLERFAPVPLLLLYGEQDDKFSLDDTLAAVKRLKALYPKPSQVKSVVYPDVGHTVTPAMLEEAEMWLKRWIQRASEPG